MASLQLLFCLQFPNFKMGSLPLSPQSAFLPHHFKTRNTSSFCLAPQQLQACAGLIKKQSSSSRAGLGRECLEVWSAQGRKLSLPPPSCLPQEILMGIGSCIEICHAPLGAVWCLKHPGYRELSYLWRALFSSIVASPFSVLNILPEWIGDKAVNFSSMSCTHRI